MSTRLLAGRYELQEKIGDGGMAVVYKARCRLLNRFVAIKILKPEFARNVKFIENFRRESQAAAGLSHPNIVNIYDVGREGNIHYIVMELIEGSILSDYIANEGPLPWQRAVEIGKQIASALAFAHKNHIIHRDVKPHNILLTQDGTAKITDFGIAKALDTSSSMDETTTVMGSVHYFSPEQARGGYVDEKSDIYSLGIVLFEMLTGHVPFDGDTPVAVALMHINSEMPLPGSLVSGIPPQIEEVVMKATDKLSINRYATADEFYDALARAEFDAMMDSGSSRKAAVTDTELSEDAADNETEFEEAYPETESMADNGEDKEVQGKKKPFNKVRFLGIIAALIVAIPFSILLSNGIKNLGNDKEFDMPDLRGQTFEVAAAVADEYGLKLEKGDTVFSVDYDPDTICSQTPDVSVKVKAGKTVVVNISKGAKEGTIPNIVGKTNSDARYLLEKYGFRVGSVTSEASSAEEGIVLRQDPAAGTESSPGMHVSFVVSAGKQEGESIVPLVVSMSESDAAAKLREAGLELGSVTYENSALYDQGIVFWQSKEAGVTVAAATAIDLKVCKNSGSSGSGDGGSSEGSGNGSVWIDYSAATNEVFWLTVTISDANGTHNAVTRAQRLKSNGGENLAIDGAGKGTITVIFDNDVVMQYDVDFGGSAN